MTDQDGTLTRAARVGSRVSLSNVRLWNAVVQQGVPSDVAADEAAQVSLSTDIQARAVVGDAGAFQTQVHYEVRGVVGPNTAANSASVDEADGADTTQSDDGEREPVLLVVASWLIDYQLADGQTADDEDLQAFATVSGTFAAHPYMREFVHGLTSRMGLPPLVLDVMRSPLDTAAAAGLGPASEHPR